MNCQEFNDARFDLHDGTLEPAAEAEAREHWEQCDPCRQAWAREERFGGQLRHSMAGATAKVSLSLESRDAIRRALARRPAQPRETEKWRRRAFNWNDSIDSFRFWRGRRPVWLGAAAVVTGLFLASTLGGLWGRRAAREGVPPATSKLESTTWVMDVPMKVETRFSEVQGGLVQDTTLFSVAYGHVEFSRKTESMEHL